MRRQYRVILASLSLASHADILLARHAMRDEPKECLRGRVLCRKHNYRRIAIQCLRYNYLIKKNSQRGNHYSGYSQNESDSSQEDASLIKDES